MAPEASVSFVLATHDRREVVLNTLAHLLGDRRPGVPFEVVVVDNASTDGTADAIREALPSVRLIVQRRNRGSCAKALGAEQARGCYTVFLDDDSYPRPGSIERMITHFERDGRLGAAGFRVHLPDGGEECSALPGVFVGCGVGLRTQVLGEVGGLDAGLFMQAEEYDLSFRLANAGWTVGVFPDLHVDHLKSPCARRSGRTVFYDARNNLLVAARYLPQPYYRVYRDDWLQRYAWLALADGRSGAYARGALAGWLRTGPDRMEYADRRLRPHTFELFFRLGYVADRMRQLADAGVRRAVFAGLGKNVYAFHAAAVRCGIAVEAIGDDRFAGPKPGGRRYRGIPIEPLDQALARIGDAVVVSNTSAIHAGRMAAIVSRRCVKPVHCWFGLDQPPRFVAPGQNESTGVAADADNQPEAAALLVP